tara:strand:- start:26461 stop:28875 length:2415 start_codon:yes stop_codon:yes gene_type:complete
MLKFFASLSILICSVLLGTAQVAGGIMDFEIDTNTNRYTIYTTLYHIGGQAIPQNISIGGPYSHVQTLQKRDTLSFIDCASPVVKSVYKSSSIFLPVPSQSGLTLSYTACCSPDFDNLVNDSIFYISLTIYRQNIPFQSGYMHPRTGTWSSTSPPLFNLRERGSAQSIQFSHISVNPRVDSIQSTLAWPFINAFDRVTWAGGYDQLSPFPDSTENPLNAANQVSSGGFLNFNVQSSSDSSKYYIYGIRNNHYRNGLRIARQFSSGLTILKDADTVSQKPLLQLISDGNIQTSTATVPVFKYQVYVDDTLEVLLRADHPTGGGIQAAYTGNNLLKGLLANPNYSQASVTAFNGSPASFFAMDSNLISLQWSPLLDNFSQGPRFTSYFFQFRDDDCVLPASQEFIVEVELKLRPRIASEFGFPFVNRSQAICEGDSIHLTVIGDTVDFFWQHPDLSSSATTNLVELSFKPSASGWIFLQALNGGKLDSLLITFSNEDSVQIFNTGTELFFDSVAFSSVLPAIWMYNNNLPLYINGPNRKFPIQGAGTYNWSFNGQGVTCSYNSEIEQVNSDQIWGAFLPSLGSVSLNPISNRLYIDFNVSNTKGLEKVFILGLAPGSTPNFGGRPQVVNLKLMKGAATIVQNTQSFLGTTELVLNVNRVLDAGDDYRLIIELDKDDYYHTINPQNLSFPFNSGDITIKAMGGLGQNGFGFPVNHFSVIGLKYNQAILNEREVVLEDFKVYPNPSSDYIRLEFKGESECYYQLLDLNGRVILSDGLKSGESIHIAHLPKGIYQLKLANGSTKKIVKS